MSSISNLPTGGGGENLADTLAIGNATAGNNFIVSSGDSIIFQDIRLRSLSSGVLEIDNGIGGPGQINVSSGILNELSVVDFAALGGAFIHKAQDSAATPTYSFANYPTTGMSTEIGGTQVSLIVGGAAKLSASASSINMRFNRLAEYRKTVANASTTQTPASQNTGNVITNIGAISGIELTLPGSPSAGNLWTFTRVEDFFVRIIPGITDHIITPTGILPDGNYIELGNVGASVTLVANVFGDWMVTSQVGTVNPE